MGIPLFMRHLMGRKRKRVVPTFNKLKSDLKIRTWGEIKQAVENAGVTDNSHVFNIDLGANDDRILIDIDPYGAVEITDDECMFGSVAELNGKPGRLSD